MRPETTPRLRALLSVGAFVLLAGACSTNREPAPERGGERTAASEPAPLPPAAPAEPRAGGGQGGQAAAGTIRVRGRLTEEGVECPALRSEDGKLYTLAGELQGFGPGDQVVVEGTVAEMSICMQGTTISVAKIERAG